jgi:signal transduction histidine kinase
MLASRGMGTFEQAIKQGRYVCLDAADTLGKFMRDGKPDAALFRQTIGGTIADASRASRSEQVLAFGEMVALLWAEGNRDAALDLERLWNDLALTHSFHLRCAYPLSGFRNAEDTQLFLNVCAEHSDVIPAETYTELNNDKERMRAVAHLQQKAQALEFEKSQRESLRKSNLELEASAAAREAELRRLGDSEQRLRELSQRLLRVQDEERRRLGSELHDSVAQYLAMLKLGLETLRSENSPAHTGAHQVVSDCLLLLEQSIERLRSVSYFLYPPMIEEAGLQTAIRWYVDSFSRGANIKVMVDLPTGMISLPRELKLTVFRVLQESLANVQRHSGSNIAYVRLRAEDGELRLEVHDEGKGIAPETLNLFEGAPGRLG